MNDDRKIPAEQIVDRAASALRETPVPTGPPVESIQAVLAAGEAAGKPLKLKTFRERIFAMNRFTKIAAAVVICAAVAALAIWLGTPESAAWADVQEKIRKAHTLTCTITVRQEGKLLLEGRMIFKEPGLVRQEMTKPERAINVINSKEGRVLSLSPKEKKAILIDMAGMPEGMTNKQKDQDYLRQLKDLVEKSQTALGEKEIGGKKAKGYKVKRKGQAFDIWVDARTGDLLEMEMRMLPAKMVVTMSDFEFDKPLDDELFSVEVPEGYEVVREMKLHENEASAEDMAGALRIWAKMRGGSFPDAITRQEMVKDMQAAGKPPSEEVAMRFGELAMSTFFLVANPERKCCYAGKGVKSGDAKTAIFWFLPKDAETYKVIYGDLSIKDVAEEDLPEAPKEEKPAEGEADETSSEEPSD